MRNGAEQEDERPLQPEQEQVSAAEPRLPRPTTSFRRRAWLEFQRALDPLAPVRELPPPRE
jgi:hypothetical protein